MKKILELKKRIKIAWWFLTKHKGAILLTCANCQGTEFELLEFTQDKKNYTSKYRCKRCNSEVINIERWSNSKIGV